MEGKRKRSSRASARLEQPNKKRNSTPPEQNSLSTTPGPTGNSTPVPEITLPRSITAGKPLPSLADPQPDDLSMKDYQSVEESGVLAESLKRSRQKLLHEDGIFERYWQKPTKKKGVSYEAPNNPPKDSMTKLGACTITIEPHVFEATMYSVKEPVKAEPPSAQFRPIIQYGPPGGVMPPPPTPPALPKAMTPAPNTPVLQASSGAQQPGSSTPSANGAARSPQPGAPAQSPQGPPKPGAPQPKSSDPMIQMLAEIAGKNEDFKTLMKLVAVGEATADQLNQFQARIEELNRVVEARKVEEAKAKAQAASIPKPAPPPAPVVAPAPIAPPPQTQALRSKGPLGPPKPDISAVVFEFVGGSGDRFLFPKFSILEFLPGGAGQVVASFLIVRRGSKADAPTYDPELDYYQPVTIRIYARNARQLEALSKAAAPQEEVRRYMDDIMDNATRAEYVLLAMRLPRDPDESPKEEADEDASGSKNQQDNDVLWTTSAETPLVTNKASKKPLDEQAQFQSFVASVR